MSTPPTRRSSSIQSPRKGAGSRKVSGPRTKSAGPATPAEQAQRPPAAAQTAVSSPDVAIEPGWIAQAAYFRAEKRGFIPGSELDDWLAAEAEVIAHQLKHEPVRGAG